MRRWKDQDRTPRHPTALHYLAQDFILLDIPPPDMALRDIAPLGITPPDITLPNIAMPDVALLDFALLDIILRDITPRDVTLLEITLPDIFSTTLYCLALLVEKTTLFSFRLNFDQSANSQNSFIISFHFIHLFAPRFVLFFLFACAQFHSTYFFVSLNLPHMCALSSISLTSLFCSTYFICMGAVSCHFFINSPPRHDNWLIVFENATADLVPFITLWPVL